MWIRPAGPRGVLVECDDLAQVMALHRALAADRPVGVVDLVPAARTVLVTFDETTTRGRLEAHLRQAVDRPSPPDGPATRPGDVVEIDVAYDGADLEEVAAQTGLTTAEVVRRHTDRTYVVAFCGFSPGFGYLVGADPALTVPRRASPRPRVPAGSVALAGEFTGVYPRSGPGGWQLIGHTTARLWDLDREPPALLAPGTRVRFARVAP
ncbi:MAG: allophanate hydrolase subunit 1 [Lapillicoccus sp.]